MKATWNDTVIAESDDTVVVEGNHYFPAESLRTDLVRPSVHRSICGWKGTAHYYTIVIDLDKAAGRKTDGTMFSMEA